MSLLQKTWESAAKVSLLERTDETGKQETLNMILSKKLTLCAESTGIKHKFKETDWLVGSWGYSQTNKNILVFL